MRYSIALCTFALLIAAAPAGATSAPAAYAPAPPLSQAVRFTPSDGDAPVALLLLPAHCCAAAADTTPPDSTTGTVANEPLFTPRDLYFAGGFIVGTLVLYPLDRNLAQFLQRPAPQANHLLNQGATFTRLMAVPGAEIIGGSMYVVGRVAGLRRVADAGLHSTEAIIVSEIITDLIKGVAGRGRPFQDPDQPFDFEAGRGFRSDTYRSFPSGHTTAAFALASSMAHEAAIWWPDHKTLVGFVLYGGASLAGLSRMYNNKHWASDVMMGAAIGSFSGWKIVRYMHSHRDNFIDRALLGHLRFAPDHDGGTYLVLHFDVN